METLLSGNRKIVALALGMMFLFFSLMQAAMRTASHAPDTKSPLLNERGIMESSPTHIGGAPSDVKLSAPIVPQIPVAKIPTLPALKKSNAPYQVSGKVKATEFKHAKANAKKEDPKKAKKKKKKKEIEKKPVRVIPAPRIPSQPTARVQEEAVPVAAAIVAPIAQGAPATLQNLNFEEWSALLLNSAKTVEATTRLIKLRQSQLIPAALFYSLVDLMLNSNSSLVRRQAVIALSATPSPESFTKLADTLEVVRDNSEVGQMILAGLVVYRQPQMLTHLFKVLRGDNAASKTMAIQQVIEAARNVSGQGTSPSSDRDVRGGGSVVTTKSPTQQFQSFYEIFNELAAHDSNASVRSLAAEGRDLLRQILDSRS